MDADELKATIKRLDAMSARCDALIKKEKPLRPDHTMGRKRLNTLANTSLNTPVASGPLAGREMSYRNYRKPRNSTNHHGSPSGYSPKISRGDMQDGSIDAIFADFEAQFDEMAQAHRA